MHKLAQHLQDLDLRAITDDDQGFLQALYASTRDDLRRFPGTPAMIANLINSQQHLQTVGYSSQFPDAHYWILEHIGKAVGRVIVNVTADEIRLVNFSLLPEARRRGFGRAILLALQQRAIANNLPLALRVNSDNPVAKRLYLALGFEVCASDQLACQMIWRPTADVDSTAA